MSEKKLYDLTVDPEFRDLIPPLNEEELKLLLGTAIKQFAKRQMTWFRRDQAIHWLDMTADPAAQACALIDGFLTGKNAGETTV